MDSKEYNESLAAELQASYGRLCDDHVVDKYAAIPREVLAPVFEEVIDVNFNVPPSSWETAYLILHSAWRRIMLRRNQLHNAANESGFGTEESLADFKKLVASEEDAILRRLDRLLVQHGG